MCNMLQSMERYMQDIIRRDRKIITRIRKKTDVFDTNEAKMKMSRQIKILTRIKWMSKALNSNYL